MTTPVLSGPRFSRVLRSEWLKIGTLRSTLVASVILLVVSVAMAAMNASEWRPPTPDHAFTGGQAMASVLDSSMSYATVVLAVLAALMITGEYATGQIQTSLTAVPARLRLLRAKVVVVISIAAGFAVAAAALTFWVTAPILQTTGYDVSPTDPMVLGAVAGNAFRLVVTGLIALFLGTILRTTTRTLTALAALLLVAPIALSMTPVPQYLIAWPAQMLAQAIAAPVIDADLVRNAVAAAVWLGGSALVAAVLLRHRDVRP